MEYAQLDGSMSGWFEFESESGSLFDVAGVLPLRQQSLTFAYSAHVYIEKTKTKGVWTCNYDVAIAE